MALPAGTGLAGAAIRAMPERRPAVVKISAGVQNSKVLRKGCVFPFLWNINISLYPNSSIARCTPKPNKSSVAIIALTLFFSKIKFILLFSIFFKSIFLFKCNYSYTKSSFIFAPITVRSNIFIVFLYKYAIVKFNIFWCILYCQ